MAAQVSTSSSISNVTGDGVIRVEQRAAEREEADFSAGRECHWSGSIASTPEGTSRQGKLSEPYQEGRVTRSLFEAERPAERFGTQHRLNSQGAGS